MFANIKESFGYGYSHTAALELASYLESSNRLNCAKQIRSKPYDWLSGCFIPMGKVLSTCH